MLRLIQLIIAISILIWFTSELSAQSSITGIKTDFNGFTESDEGTLNTTRIDSQNNLLGFTVGGVIYSTGVDDGLLVSNGISFTAANYAGFIPSFAVSSRAGQGSNDDGDINIFSGQIYPTPEIGSTGTYDVRQYITDGINGLGMSTFANNVGGTFTFDLTIIDASTVGDGVPDLFYFNMAGPSGSSVEFAFYDAMGNLIGNVTGSPENIHPDIANVQNDRFNTSDGGNPAVKKNQAVQGFALEFSDLGLTQMTLLNASRLDVILPSTADPPFIAYNTDAFAAIDPLACTVVEAGLSNVSCMDNGTSTNTDDIITFELNPTGNNIGSSYILNVSSGSISPTSGNYGQTTLFSLQPGSAGAGDVIVSISDIDDSANCKLELNITDPGTCSNSILIDVVKDDDIINALEDDSDILISGIAINSEGQVLTLELNGITYITTIAVDGSWSVSIPAADVQAFDLTETIIANTDGAIQASRMVTYDVVAEIEISTPIAIDAIVNSTEDSLVSINGSTIGVEEGQTVTVSFDDGINPPILVTTLVSGGMWEVSDVNIDGLNNGSINVSASVFDLAGNHANHANETITLDNELPIINITAPIEIDNIVNADEDNNVTIIGSTTGVEDGQIVTVTFEDEVNPPIQATAVVSGGMWIVSDIDLSGLNNGSIDITADVNDLAGNPAHQASNVVILDNELPIIYMTTPIEIDDIVNAEEDANVTISGTTIGVEDDQTVTVTFDDGVNPPIQATAVVSGGMWTVIDADISGLDNGHITVTADVNDLASNSALQSVTSFELDNVFPISPTLEELVTTNPTPILSGSAEPGSELIIEVAGAAFSIIVNDTGFWTLDLSSEVPLSGIYNPELDGINEITISSTDIAGNTTIQSFPNSISILTGDTDGDLVDNNDEDVNGDSDLTNDDSDGDGIPDYLDLDDDGDSIPSGEEDANGDGNPANDDSDGDGIPDYLDEDSDNDGISDEEEGNDDVDGDGIPDFVDEDSDSDGIPDINEGNDDLDGDGIPNNEDEDSDGDGILDIDEGDGDVDGDGIPDYQDEDSDNDGISDEEEGNDDVDGDGIPDFVDEDSDSDGIPDIDEGNDDLDGDGIPNNKDEDSDGDGILDIDEGNDDIDGDGIPDYQDQDSDGDGILDSDEGNGDVDGDGIPNNEDEDSDGDGLLDEDEGNDDTDGDGIPNNEDTDSDGDGEPDSEESSDPTEDCDGDGIPDFLDSSSCQDDLETTSVVTPNGDGINDVFEIQGITNYPNNSVKIFNRWGNLVWETVAYDNVMNAFHGNNNYGLFTDSGQLPDGTYFMIIDRGDGSRLQKGFVVIKR